MFSITYLWLISGSTLRSATSHLPLHTSTTIPMALSSTATSILYSIIFLTHATVTRLTCLLPKRHVFLTSSGRARLENFTSAFQYANRAHDTMPLSSITSTPLLESGWQSPEYYKNKQEHHIPPPTTPSDIWSFGCMIFNVRNFTSLFPNSSIGALLFCRFLRSRHRSTRLKIRNSRRSSVREWHLIQQSNALAWIVVFY